MRCLFIFMSLSCGDDETESKHADAASHVHWALGSEFDCHNVKAVAGYSSSSSQIRVFLTLGARAGAAEPAGSGPSGSAPSRYSRRAAKKTRTSPAGTASHH